MSTAEPPHIYRCLPLPIAPAAVAKKLSSIPDPTKDIGFNIMSRFHYSPEVELRIYDNLADAVKSLE